MSLEFTVKATFPLIYVCCLPHIAALVYDVACFFGFFLRIMYALHTFSLYTRTILKHQSSALRIDITFSKQITQL